MRLLRVRFTVRRMMAVVAAIGGILGLLLSFGPDDREVIGWFLAISMGFVVPIHLAIEGNRRDASGSP